MRKLADRELRLIARPKRKDLFRAQSIPFLRPDRKTKFLTCRFQSASYSLTPFAALFPHFSPSLPAARRREAKGRWRHLSDRRRRKKREPAGLPAGPPCLGMGDFFYEAKEIAAKRKGRGAEKFPASFFLLSLYLHYTTFFQRKTPDDAKGAFAAARGNFFRRTPPEKTAPAYLSAKKHPPRGVLAM